MDLHPDWKEFIQLLNSHAVEYVVVGAHAVAFYVNPRLTADIDFLVARNSENSARLAQALIEFGFNLPKSEIEKLGVENHILQLGTAPYRIDLLTSILGVSNDTIFEHKVPGEIGGEPTWFISREDLVAAKRGSGRPKDLVDLSALE